MPLRVLPGSVGAIPSWDSQSVGGYACPSLGCRVARRQRVHVHGAQGWNEELVDALLALGVFLGVLVIVCAGPGEFMAMHQQVAQSGA